MRSIVVSNLISLDGYLAGPGGEIDWFEGLADREFEAHAIERFRSIDTILFGRVTYQLMQSYWPTASPDTDNPFIIRMMNDCAKIVFSRTLSEVTWNNSALARRDPAAEVSRLKALKGNDMVIFGSGSIVSALARAGLIDEYRIYVAPVVLGGGIAMFREQNGRIALRSRRTQRFGTGMVYLEYEPVRP